jgi:hypothetical protein
MTMTRMSQLLQQLETAQASLEQRVDHQDVRAMGAHLLERRAPVGEHVKQLNVRLRVQHVADVLGDLCDVLDEQQADLRGRARHGATIA